MASTGETISGVAEGSAAAVRLPGVARGGAFLIEPLGSREIFTAGQFTDEQLAYAKTAETFVTKEVLPRLDAIEAREQGLMPRLLRRAGELGLLMIDIPEQDGGLGLDKATSMLVSERAAKVASFSVSWGAHTGIGTLPLVYYGTAAQKARYLPKLASGEMLAAYALTEPGSGSDATAARTTAVLAPDGTAYLLNGVKQFITNAGFADLFTVFAKIDGEKFSAFLVERGFPGVSTGPEEQKLGIKGSSTRQLILQDARVPVENLLGEPGRGHKIAFNILNVGRFKLGSGAVGAARECLDSAIRYASERRQFGRPIAEFGAIQQKLADMATRIFVADAMSYRTAGLMDEATRTLDAGVPDRERRAVEVLEEYTIECSIIKVFGTECLDVVADEALQVLGGYGFTEEYPIARHYRDARINRIFEGTNEINRLIIPATLLKRITKGALPYLEFTRTVQEEIAHPDRRPACPLGPLAREVQACEMAKRVVAYTVLVILQRDLASLAEKQQHLLLLADMIIDVYAMESVTARVQEQLRREPALEASTELDMAYVFVASANQRVAGLAARPLANESEGDELERHLETVRAFTPFIPIRTIDAKTRIAKRLVADQGWRFS
ncbi:MAG: acyl-CoA dehydrogenase family protein [Candidatus Rokubacteria bacterium]|nr:acyl-CoA dehydrogenase family protein [Candidatus Rokubacteria bacterium]